MVNHRTAGGRAAHLSAEDLAALRASLHEQRLFRQEQLRQVAAAEPAPAHRPPGTGAAGASAAGGCAAAREEVRNALAASARMVLADVEAALERIREGHYGICPQCHRPIPLNHLMVVPQARYCGLCRRARGSGA